ncbi:four helix bundle protein [Candidatus Kaiserbacteria bacterium]|nr:four helix bundle protein [Candidatus Kaiserbacteria bacterium]
MQSYRELIVWQKSRKFVTEVYRLTENFPKSEMFGLTSQMRRAVVSIPANIAEGYARKHRAEYIQFLRISYGSGAELETFLLLIEDLKYVTAEDLRSISEKLQEIMRMLNKLIDSLKPKS